MSNMGYKKQPDRMPASDYLTNWGKRALTDIRILSATSRDLDLINGDAFTQQAERSKRDPELASALCEFGSRLSFIVNELPGMEAPEIKTELDEMYRLIDDRMLRCSKMVKQVEAPQVRLKNPPEIVSAESLA